MTKMHADEFDIDDGLVVQLLRTQFPQWASLSVVRLSSAGTDNAIYRLGTDMMVRLPRVPWSVAQVAKEQRWLLQLAPLLPLEIPTPLGMGYPTALYPWPWSVYRWIEGENAFNATITDAVQAARDLAAFIRALQQAPAADGPAPGAHNSGRGVPLAQRDAAVRQALAQLDGVIDTGAAAQAWDHALQAERWSGAPVWLHGDLQAGNLLLMDGRLRAVIDFGCMGVGDPACDLQVAWNMFSSEARAAFRQVLAVDEATWQRGRGWALSVALIALPYYLHTNPVLVSISRYTLSQVLTTV